jgi:predicted RNase H-like HicB family nuclease
MGEPPRVISRPAFQPEQGEQKHSEEVGTMVNRYFVNIEPIEPSGFVLTVEALPRLLIFGETIEDALRRAREAIGFQLRDASRSVERTAVELVPRDLVGASAPVNAAG